MKQNQKTEEGLKSQKKVGFNIVTRSSQKSLVTRQSFTMKQCQSTKNASDAKFFKDEIQGNQRKPGRNENKDPEFVQNVKVSKTFQQNHPFKEGGSHSKRLGDTPLKEDDEDLSTYFIGKQYN